MRIVVGSPTGDQHRSGADALARVLRDAGHEVVWAGADQLAEQLVATAVQEDADLVGVAVPPGEGADLEQELTALLADQGASDIGARVFEAGTAVDDIRSWAGEDT